MVAIGLGVLALLAGHLLTVPVMAGDPSVGRSASDAIAAAQIDLSGAAPAQHRGGARLGRRQQPAQQKLPIAAAIEAQGQVQQVGYLEPNCGAGVFEATCGCETVCDCPVERVAQPLLDPSCGLEASCGIEVSCGAEPWVGSGVGCGATGCNSAGCGGCCDSMDPNCGCDACCGSVRFLDGLFPRLCFNWNRWDFFAGVNGFTGPMNFADTGTAASDHRGTGSFGFYEGFNRGRTLMFFDNELSIQTGARFTQTNLSGSGFTDDPRSQVFLTGGFFRRVDYGFQYGLVFDYLSDDWYHQADLTQLRGELGWVLRNSHVFGLQFTAGLDSNSSDTTVVDNTGATIRNTVVSEALSQYRLFYRQQLARCGSCEGFIGGTENNDTLLGVDVNLPLHRRLLWNTSATYLIPDEGANSGGEQHEGWNLAIGVTFRPGGLGSGSRYERPLLNVADNSTLMVDRR
ncbi:hypothetical protein NHH03_26460 [Stieleria sp. TO1_6]|uniref:DUF6666 family protein n=1 Tax=Stieleria tagensis TaxID=2956795 RepID=UPI00209AC377|nr:DUF6666 family protein [Stieleria tagensis]MCO8125309.1 hypothetical protein [Stieleria tagensis]